MKANQSTSSFSEIEKRLQEARIHPTAQRIAICRYVLGEADHPTAEQIKAWADRNFQKMSMATVYNTLKTLVNAGILKEFQFPHSDSAVYDGNTSFHYHFLDEKTGELIDIAPEEIEMVLKLQKNFEVKGISVFLRGERV